MYAQFRFLSLDWLIYAQSVGRGAVSEKSGFNSDDVPVWRSGDKPVTDTERELAWFRLGDMDMERTDGFGALRQLLRYGMRGGSSPMTSGGGGMPPKQVVDQGKRRVLAIMLGGAAAATIAGGWGLVPACRAIVHTRWFPWARDIVVAILAELTADGVVPFFARNLERIRDAIRQMPGVSDEDEDVALEAMYALRDDEQQRQAVIATLYWMNETEQLGALPERLDALRSSIQDSNNIQIEEDVLDTLLTYEVILAAIEQQTASQTVNMPRVPESRSSDGQTPAPMPFGRDTTTAIIRDPNHSAEAFRNHFPDFVPPIGRESDPLLCRFDAFATLCRE